MQEMSASGVKQIGETIASIGVAIKSSSLPHANQIGLMVEEGGKYIAGASDALIGATSGHSDAEVAGKMLTSYFFANAGLDLTLWLVAARLPLLLAGLALSAPATAALTLGLIAVSAFVGTSAGAHRLQLQCLVPLCVLFETSLEVFRAKIFVCNYRKHHISFATNA
jgi:hypothetical protein